MCGISGEIRFDGERASVEAVMAMSAAMQARGPDGDGIVAHGPVAFGHRRLAVIDLSAAAQQPMVDAELGLTIVFNGCIYNHGALRDTLRGLGYRFFSTGDTEVLLKAWHAWGPAALDRLAGMFAFAILERDSGRLVLARDRFGVKPLYFTATGARLRFASALPALLAAGGVDTSIDRIALHHYLSWHGAVPAPATILAGVRKLAPATWMAIEPDGRMATRVWWNPPLRRCPEDVRMTASDWHDAVLDSLRRAVARRTVADVPVGVLLSGGVDSSLIVGLLAEAGQRGLQTFSIGFDAAAGESGDEFAYSDWVANHFGTVHQRWRVPAAGLAANLPAMFGALAEPMPSPDAIGFYLLGKEVSRQVKVVQCGQGADEVFGGYYWHRMLGEPTATVAGYARTYFDRNHVLLCSHVSPEWHCELDPSRQLFEARIAADGADTLLDRALRFEARTILGEDPARRVDNMTMAWGIEARTPFLDHELVELAARIPPAMALADGGKGVLKAAARRLVPPEVIDRPKGYFPVPQLRYLSGPCLDLVRDALESRAARARGLFRPGYLRRLFAAQDKHLLPIGGSELWQVAALELWLQHHRL